jgi:hypothetical protein
MTTSNLGVIRGLLTPSLATRLGQGFRQPRPFVERAGISPGACPRPGHSMKCCPGWSAEGPRPGTPQLVLRRAIVVGGRGQRQCRHYRNDDRARHQAAVGGEREQQPVEPSLGAPHNPRGAGQAAAAARKRVYEALAHKSAVILGAISEPYHGNLCCISLT